MKTERQIKNRLKKVEEESAKHNEDPFKDRISPNPERADIWLTAHIRYTKEIDTLKWILEIK